MLEVGISGLSRTFAFLAQIFTSQRYQEETIYLSHVNTASGHELLFIVESFLHGVS